MRDSTQHRVATEAAPLRLGRKAFIAIALCPALFIFIMIQMSAITFPFWDHWAQATFIVTYYDHGFMTAAREVITSLSQHTRPITVRMIFLVNGIFTDWDIRSEYIYMYAVFAATLFTHYRLINKLDPRYPSLIGAILFSVISIVYFSPANHNNHWWSWMLQLDLNNLLTLLAFIVISFQPRSITNNATAAILCWLSIYTLTNGLFLILIIASLSQLGSENPLRPSKLTVFWIINIATVYWTYFPIQEPGTSAHPNLLNVLRFSLSYLGNPVASLLHFPYENMFEPPNNIYLSSACGAFLLGFYLILLFKHRSLLLKPTPQFLLFIGFGGFAILSALITGWARVDFDSYGLRNGSSSRYVITGSYLLFSILYFPFAERERYLHMLDNKLSCSPLLMLMGAVYLSFLCISLNTYIHSVKIYKQARDHNNYISNGFSSDGSDTRYDNNLYPDQAWLHQRRNDLLRLNIGPYKYQKTVTTPLTDDQVVGAITLSTGTRVSQKFSVTAGRLTSLSFPLVTWGLRPSAYPITFRLSEISDSGPMLLAEKTVSANDLSDWETIQMTKFAIVAKQGSTFVLEASVPGSQIIEKPVGLALSKPFSDEISPANSEREGSAPSGGAIRITITRTVN